MTAVICHTQGCGNAEIPLELEHPIDWDTGEPVDPWNVYCGVCGEQITDVGGSGEAPPERPDRPDNTLPERPETPDQSLPETPDPKESESRA